MNFLHYLLVASSCFIVGTSDDYCVFTPVSSDAYSSGAAVAAASVTYPRRTGQAVDVVLTAHAALAWDWDTGEELYALYPEAQRPIASLSKMLTVLTARQSVEPTQEVTITQEAIAMQNLGANIRLPLGEHVQADQLYKAALIPSANDAAVALAVAAAGSEKHFVAKANAYARVIGLTHTLLSNATGLHGGDQYSTAHDVKRMLQLVYQDPFLQPYLAAERGLLVTQEGSRRSYQSTNKLLASYLPILAGKTGYTAQAGQNLAIVTYGPDQHMIGVVVLGSEDRFQDTKVLVEWIHRNYTWK